MLLDINLPLILVAAFVAGASPGPATLAIAGTSMASGRTSGLALASGITAGSLIWSISAALGLGAIMLANAMQPAQELDTGMFITKLEQTTLHLLTSKPLQQRRAWGNVEILAYWGEGLWEKAISKKTLRVRMSARLKAAKKKDTHLSLPRVEILNFRPLLVAKPSSTIICRTL